MRLAEATFGWRELHCTEMLDDDKWVEQLYMWERVSCCCCRSKDEKHKINSFQASQLQTSNKLTATASDRVSVWASTKWFIRKPVAFKRKIHYHYVTDYRWLQTMIRCVESRSCSCFTSHISDRVQLSRAPLLRRWTKMLCIVISFLDDDALICRFIVFFFALPLIIIESIRLITHCHAMYGRTAATVAVRSWAET